MTLLLLAILAISGIAIVFTRKLILAVVMLSAFSLVSALLFYILKAPDVAITEAAVGAGVSTVIFLWAIKVSKDEPPRN